MEGEGITMDDKNTIVPDQEPEFEKYWDVSETAFQYGKAVGWREHYAHGENDRLFEECDQRCMALWKKLIALGAYVDDEGSDFHPQARAHYLAGLESVPDREPDWEEYWENMYEEFGDEE